MKWIRHGNKMLNTDYFLEFSIEEFNDGWIVKGIREDADRYWGPYKTEQEAEMWLLNIAESLA